MMILRVPECSVELLKLFYIYDLHLQLQLHLCMCLDVPMSVKLGKAYFTV